MESIEPAQEMIPEDEKPYRFFDLGETTEKEDEGPAGFRSVNSPSPFIEHISRSYLPQTNPEGEWKAYRRSKAVTILQEVQSGQSIVAKFYIEKSKSSPHKYALREYQNTIKAHALGLKGGTIRAGNVFGVHRGVLFLEHVQGTTLLDSITAGNGRKISLERAITLVAELLSILHVHSARLALAPIENHSIEDTIGYVHELEKYGVLQEHPDLVEDLIHQIEIWAHDIGSTNRTTTLLHGDTTTSNFIITPQDGIVAIDWERMKQGDPAFDIGRFLAELTHSLEQAGEITARIEEFCQTFLDMYISLTPNGPDRNVFESRGRFFQASSMLRIARNGWISRADRTQIVQTALSLLQR